jgi:hypothetical protein
MPQLHTLTAILPCNNLDISENFYSKLGFARKGGTDDYRMLSNGQGGEIHLTTAVEGWLVPGRNPFGLYLYSESLILPRREDHGSLSCQQPKSKGLLEVQFDDRVGVAQVTDRDVLPDI